MPKGIIPAGPLIILPERVAGLRALCGIGLDDDKRDPNNRTELRAFCRVFRNWIARRRNHLLGLSESGRDVLTDGRDYTEEIQVVWHHLFRLAGPGSFPPPLRVGPYPGDQAIAALDRVIAWCDGEERGRDQVDAVSLQYAADKPVDQAGIALMTLYTDGLSDERIKEASRLLADDSMTANDKLTKIDSLIPIPATASAHKLGQSLGVSKQAILKTDWWERHRKGEKQNEVGRRHAEHQKRAKDYEEPGCRDEN